MAEPDSSGPKGGTLFVRNIAFKTSEEEFTKAFEDYGPITSSFLVKDKETSKSRGFGYVTYSLWDDAEKASKGVKSIDGRRVSVSFAHSSQKNGPEKGRERKTSQNEEGNDEAPVKENEEKVPSSPIAEPKVGTKASRTKASRTKALTAKQERHGAGSTVVLTGLGADTTTENIQKLVSELELKNVSEITFPAPEREDSAALLGYTSNKDAVKAVKKLNGHKTGEKDGKLSAVLLAGEHEKKKVCRFVQSSTLAECDKAIQARNAKSIMESGDESDDAEEYSGEESESDEVPQTNVKKTKVTNKEVKKEPQQSDSEDDGVHHGSPSTKCEACITGFTTKEEMMNHVRIHYLYCCNFCSLNTNSWNHYKEHVSEHCKATPYILTWTDGKKVHECSTCVDGFDNVDDLEAHFVEENLQKFKESYLEFMIDLDEKQASKDHFMLPNVTKPKEENNETQGEAYRIIGEDFISQTALTSQNVPSIEQPHVSPICQKGVRRAGDRKKHVRIHTGEKPHLRPVCKKGFSHAGNMKEHMRIHTGEKPHLCPVCQKGFRQAWSMKRHMTVHTGEKTHLCSVCQKGFSQAWHMKEHMRIHTGEKPYVCSVCKKSFSRAQHMEQHMRIHAGEKPYVCSVCKKGFRQAGDMKEHIRIHTGEKPHLCSVCKKGFRQAWSMKRHMTVHTGEKTHLCSVCQKGFSQAWHMKEHMRIHTGEKPYVCSVCKKSFSRAQHMEQHMRIHAGEKPYVCSVCKKGFRQAGDMKVHMRVHTGEKPHLCPICEKGFSRTGSMKKHVKVIHEKEKR